MKLPGIYKTFLDRWNSFNLQSCWIISDTHFNDKEIENNIVGCPSAEDLIKNINAKCGKNDLLIHLGDVGDVSYVKKIRARYKILIMGNHDAGRTNYERKTWRECFPMEDYTEEEALEAMKKMYPDCRYYIEEIYQFHGRFCYWEITADNMLFDEVYEGPLMIAEKLILSHEPIDVPWAYNIHGHIHDKRHKNDNKHFNVCANIINYTPINFNQWMKGGHLSHIETLHRSTIDTATKRKHKRKGKKIGE